MRDAFHEQLQHLTDRMVEMANLVEVAVREGTGALLEADARRAERVIAADAQIDRLQSLVEERTFEQLALQQPVASDLRALVAALRMVADLERMGDLAEHVAKIARMRYPECAIPAELHDTIAEMGSVAERMVHKVAETVRSSDVTQAVDLVAEDDQMDRLRRSLFHIVLDKDWSHGVEAAIDIALLGRYYERIADHAVSMARRVIYLVTGDVPVRSS
ncbi:phosphate transport system protein [Actinopolymorpha cephalotaxi]|uniref:Phosphate-specific transport system accessory protein PhoU n=1 Tax=Actinopolymorpha cephalotaxi TaxID=504797 RepID=A0A1I2Y3U3_9ACTN|nr:phosphate signaling complex protein PhoU [Actinopolymorpha cephalotaxi]NYH87306.1 phosphate transport system protein [Actinopolymorpha cephalotaxi]SFH20017.1 phosphate transport system protein [Actinopolymorpha cephalotaxi]